MGWVFCLLKIKDNFQFWLLFCFVLFSWNHRIDGSGRISFLEIILHSASKRGTYCTSLCPKCGGPWGVLPGQKSRPFQLRLGEPCWNSCKLLANGSRSYPAARINLRLFLHVKLSSLCSMVRKQLYLLLQNPSINLKLSASFILWKYT